MTAFPTEIWGNYDIVVGDRIYIINFSVILEKNITFYFQSINSFNLENIADSQLMGRKQGQTRMSSVSYKVLVVYAENNLITKEYLLEMQGNGGCSVPLHRCCNFFLSFY